MYSDGQTHSVPQARPQQTQQTQQTQQVQQYPEQALHAYEDPRNDYLAQPDRHSINFKIDEDAKNVLEQITPELREAFVTIAIKHFQHDPMFHHYFKKVTHEQLEIVPNPTQPTQHTQPTQYTQATQVPSQVPSQVPGPGQGQGQAPTQADSNVNSGFSDW